MSNNSQIIIIIFKICTILTYINLGSSASKGEYERRQNLAGARDNADQGVIQLH